VEFSKLRTYTKECTKIGWMGNFKKKFKTLPKKYKNWLLRKYMVVLRCGVYNITHRLLMLQNWKNIKNGYH
jgi:hypothetical protein